MFEFDTLGRYLRLNDAGKTATHTATHTAKL